MREEIENIFNRYLYEVNDALTRREIKFCIESYLLSLVNSNQIINFKVEDKTTDTEIENNRIHFQIIYQKPGLMMYLMDIYTDGSTLGISDFENGVIGNRYIPKLKF